MTGLRTLHKWLGWIAGPMVLLAAGTAVGLNHPTLVQGALPRPSAAGPYAHDILATAVDPRDPRHVLVGTSDGLFRSHDGGQRWEEAVLPVPAEQAVAVAFDRQHPGVVYLALRSIGLWRSTDGGGIWEDVALPFAPADGMPIRGMALAAEGSLLLATPGGLWTRANPGAAWVHAGGVVPPPDEPGKRRLQLIYDLHDGRFWREWGVPVTDAVSLLLIALVLTGYGMSLWTAWWRRAARRGRGPAVGAAPS